jgi:CRP/FNR family cyclic AMP-dependent transcriptional regulator
MSGAVLRDWPVGPAGRRRTAPATLADREQALAGAPLFSSLPKKQLRSISKVTGVWAYPENTVIVQEGKPGGSFYVILEGRASVRNMKGKVGSLSTGDFFGEISLLDPGPRMASVVAETPVKCIELAGRDFLDVIEGESRIANNILRVLAGRLRRAEHPLID